MTLPTHTVKVFMGGAWVDITADVEHAQPMTHSWGRSDRYAQKPTAGGFTFQVDNRDGKYSADNPAAAYFRMFVEGVPVAWSAGARTRAFTITSISADYVAATAGSLRLTVTCTDVIGDLESTPLASLLEMVTQAAQPIAYWTLGEAANNLDPMLTTFVDSSGNLQPDLQPTGPADHLVFQQFPVPDQSEDGSLQVVNNNNNSALPQVALTLVSPPTTPLNWRQGTVLGWSFEAWFRVNPGNWSTQQWPIVVVRMKSGRSVRIVPYTGTSTGNYLGVRAFSDSSIPDPYSTTMGLVPVGAGVTDATLSTGGSHRVRFTEMWDTSAKTLSGGWGADTGPTGVYTQWLNPSPYVTLTDDDFTIADIQLLKWTDNYAFRGWISHVSFRKFTSEAQLVDADSFGVGATGPAESPVSRVNRILGLSGLPALSTTGTARGGNLTRQRTLGVSALDAVCDALRYDGSVPWATSYPSGAGALPQVSAVLWSASKPYTAAITLDCGRDGDGIPTLVRESSGVVQTVTAGNSDVSTTYTDRTVASTNTDSVSAASRSRSEQAYIAQDRVAQAQQARFRITGFTINLATNETVDTDTLLGLVPGARVRVTSLQRNLIGQTTRDYYLLGADESYQTGDGTVTLRLYDADSPAEAQTFPASAPTYGDQYTRAYGEFLTTTVMTAASTSVTFNGPVPISTSAADYPMKLDVGGECVLVNSAPSGSGPWTATVVRGQETTEAAPHPVGTVVCPWLKPSAAF